MYSNADNVTGKPKNRKMPEATSANNHKPSNNKIALEDNEVVIEDEIIVESEDEQQDSINSISITKTTPQETRLFKAECSIHIVKRKIPALLNTGAQRSFMRLELFKQIVQYSKLWADMNGSIVTASSESFPFQFGAILKLQIGENLVPIWLYAVKHLRDDVVLGMDFCRNHMVALFVEKYCHPSEIIQTYLPRDKEAISQLRILLMQSNNPPPEPISLNYTAQIKSDKVKIVKLEVSGNNTSLAKLDPHQVATKIYKQIEDTETGAVEGCDSTSSSEPLLVQKKDGRWRLCVNYRGLNARTYKFRYPLSKTTQLSMWKVVVSINDWVVVSQTLEDHAILLKTLISVLKEQGFELNVDKRKLCKNPIEYLGFITDKDGVHINSKVIQPIFDSPVPTNTKLLRRFLGMVNRYHRHLKMVADIQGSLNKLCSPKSSWKWSNEAQKSFETSKQALIDAPTLFPADPKLSFRLYTDASDTGIGAVLVQYDKEKDTKYLITCISRPFLPAERNYHTSEKECLGVIWSVSKLRHFLEGVLFSVFTDHSALTSLMTATSLKDKLAR
ncbi:uncharacterized protein [Chelonus insularis]|uniref:uncharacterized protein n=1 Tax=Chelonus insularis TaxID=460826 RepID=UPI00158E4770|nr:uncharacterized protein LOC118069811 [Chelonus insularis]